MYYRRTRRLDVPLITAIRLLPEPPPETLSAELEGWVKSDGNLHSGVWPSQEELRIWYKTRDQDWVRREKRQEEVSYEYGEVITEVDVVYGDDQPFFGFERVQGGKVTEGKEGRWESVDLAFRRGTYGQLRRQRLLVVPANDVCSPAESCSTAIPRGWYFQGHAESAGSVQ